MMCSKNTLTIRRKL